MRLRLHDLTSNRRALRHLFWIFAALTFPSAACDIEDEGISVTRKPDAGAEVVDAGAEVVVSGAEVVDAGAEVVDAGAEVVDAGAEVGGDETNDSPPGDVKNESGSCDDEEEVDDICWGLWEGSIWDHPSCPLVYKCAPDPPYVPSLQGEPLVTGSAAVGGNYFADTIPPGTPAKVYATHEADPSYPSLDTSFVELAAVSEAGVQTTLEFTFWSGLGSEVFAPGCVISGPMNDVLGAQPLNVNARAGWHGQDWWAYDWADFIVEFRVSDEVGANGMRTYSYRIAFAAGKMGDLAGTFQLVPPAPSVQSW